LYLKLNKSLTTVKQKVKNKKWPTQYFENVPRGEIDHFKDIEMGLMAKGEIQTFE